MSAILKPIADLLVQLLHVFFQWTGSYGVAVILLTLAVKLIMHPLTRRQLRSMKEMQYLGPQMQALREKYRDEPQRLNAEIMNLYRAHNVNPFGGCLPMLVQIPVLWGLFAALRRQGIFADATFLGMALQVSPSFAEIARNPLMAVWPVLVGLTTYLQQRLSITDPQQARMFIIMPIMFAYFATTFPVGMSIYWTVSTLAYMLEYFIVVGRFTPPAPAAPIGPEKTAIAVLPQRPRGTKRK